MSISISHTRCAGLLVVAAVAAGGVTAGPANAKKLTHKQKTAIRAQLKKEAKKHPSAVLKRKFIKRASLVDFKLPATIRVGTKDSTGAFKPNATGVNTAKLDLGPSLGVRTLGLNGSLPAEIQFHDAYDGGGLGNVDLVLNPSATGGLQTTSVPLLSNPDVTTQPMAAGGCQDFFGTATSGVDDSSVLTATNTPGENDLGNGGPLPGVASPNDVVLRTGSLNLRIATPSGGTVPGTTIGKSGGQANLFGQIPNKASGVGVDVTANLVTNINSILREVDLQEAGNNATAFNCRQAWTGTVENHITGVKLTGSLRISPAIMADGKLRIAKTRLSSSTPAQVALTACLMPMQAYAHETGNIPASPIDPSTSDPAPTAACNSMVSPALNLMFGVNPFANLGAPLDGYTVSNNGSTVSVMGNIDVEDLTADVLIGQNQ